jgi:YD repeat-containing protein
MSEYTEYGYDNEGRQVRSTQYLRNASDQFSMYAETVFEYTAGLLARETVSYPAQVAVTTYEYAGGRLAKKSFLDGNDKLLHYTVYQYDGAGNLTGEANFTDSGSPARFVRYTYRNGLREVQQTFSGDPAGPTPTLWSTIRYGYDAQKRLVSEETEYINPLSSAIFPMVKYEYY